ncbi:hypothetical protein VKS41_008117 [Umbelopsis sp. WA50703]
MGAEAIDYRVSKIVVLCKDCGQDVGMYPARHKCEDVVRPPLPPLPSSTHITSRQNRDISRDRSPVRSVRSVSPPPSPMPSKKSDSNRTPKFGRNLSADAQDDGQEEQQIYFNDIAESSSGGSTPSGSGKKLWGNLKQNDKWKQLAYGDKQPSQGARLWDKLMQATQNMTDKIPNRDDKGPESDESDWEGETHISRILREHHEKKGGSLPHWLRDSKTPISSRSTDRDRYSEEDSRRISENTRHRQRLWDAGDETPELTPRERERQRLREEAERREDQRHHVDDENASRSLRREKTHASNNRNEERFPSRSEERLLSRSATTAVPDQYRHDERSRRHDRERLSHRQVDHYSDRLRSEDFRPSRDDTTGREPPVDLKHRPSRREMEEYEYRHQRSRGRSPIYDNPSEQRMAPPMDRERLRGPRRAPPKQKLDNNILDGGYF